MSASPEVPDAIDVGQQGSRDRTGRHAMVMAAGTLVSRTLGFVRGMLLVTALGLTGSVAAESFAVANKLPNIMFAVLAAGVLNSALVPQIVKAFREGRERTVHRLLTVAGTGMLVATPILTLLAGFWVQIYSSGWTPEQTALATAFAYWCIPQLLFYGLYALWGQVLNAREQFGWFMWAPAVNNFVSIVGFSAFLVIFGPYVVDDDKTVAAIVADWTPAKIALLAGVATFGIVCQAALLIAPMIKGGYTWRWVWRGPKGELTIAAKVASWAVGAILVEQLGVLVVSNISTAAQAAAPHDPTVAGVNAYDFAVILFLVPHSLVSISLMTVLFTAMAKHAVSGDIAKLKDVMSQGVRNVGVFTVFATAVIAVTAPHLVRILSPAENVTGESVEAVAWVLRFMVLGLVPLGASVMVKQAYFALEDGRTVFLIHIPMALSAIAVAFAVKVSTGPEWWVRGVALGLAAANTVAVVGRLWGLRGRLHGVDGRRIVSTHARAGVAALAAAGVGLALAAVLPRTWEPSGPWASLASAGVVALVSVVMLVVYGLGCRLLRVQEADAVSRSLIRRLRRVR